MFAMAIARLPAIVTMPDGPRPYPSILGFLTKRFPQVMLHVWSERIRTGKVLGKDRNPITLATPYVALERLYYFREVEDEKVIPFAETILYQDANLLVADKPHFLPTTEGGRFVEQSLLHRLRERTGNDAIAPLHRLDRETAGLALFSLNPKTAAIYHSLFQKREVGKVYHAISACSAAAGEREWRVANRIERGVPAFRSQVVDGIANASTRIVCIGTRGGRTAFRLYPITGKKHQLRVHMASLGFAIENDRCYPLLQDERPDDFGKPLQLLAKELHFVDPLSGADRRFESELRLDW